MKNEIKIVADHDVVEACLFVLEGARIRLKGDIVSTKRIDTPSSEEWIAFLQDEQKILDRIIQAFLDSSEAHP